MRLNFERGQCDVFQVGWLLRTKKKNDLSAINHLSIPCSFEECELERLKNVFITEKTGRTINLETKPNLVLPS